MGASGGVADGHGPGIGTLRCPDRATCGARAQGNRSQPLNRGICDLKSEQPDLAGRVVMVGYTAAGRSDAKPTPVNAAMPGVEVHAEATEALLSGSAIWMRPAGFSARFHSGTTPPRSSGST
ncbi:MAG: CHASE2 domain-containing protein [Luteimonas sp.]